MNEFKKLRLLAGKSITNAAEEISVSASTIHCWETGKFSPKPGCFSKIASCYGCSMEAIVNAYAAQN